MTTNGKPTAKKRLIIVFIAMIAALSGCDLLMQFVGPDYSVTYACAIDDSGTVPVDSKSYKTGSSATVLGNTGDLARSRYTFAGWNPNEDGSGTTLAAGASILIAKENVRLYAMWTALPPEMHAVGYSISGMTNTAEYYIDGLSTPLGEASGKQPSGIVFDGANVYIPGYGASGSPSGYWKNGSWLALPDFRSAGMTIFPTGNSGMAVQADTVYYLGTRGEGAASQIGYYRGDVWIPLPIPASATSNNASSIAILGSETIVPGTCTFPDSTKIGYWRDTVWHELPMPSGASNAAGAAPGIKIIGSDVYIYSFLKKTETTTLIGYWKNDVWNEVHTYSGSAIFVPIGLGIMDGDIVIGLYKISISDGSADTGYWYRSNWYPVTARSGMFPISQSMTVSGSDVYLTGSYYGMGIAPWGGYWKNGLWNQLWPDSLKSVGVAVAIR